MTDLARAPERPETRAEAAEAVRGFLNAIVLIPTEGKFGIELKGKRGGDAERRHKREEVAETGDLVAS